MNLRLSNVQRLPVRAPTLLFVAGAFLQPWLEADMARHMGLELPFLFMLGWLYAVAGGRRLCACLAPWNAHGLTAWVVAMAATGFWMLPVALDLAVLNPWVGLAKVASLVLAGLLLGASWRQSSPVIQAFFVFNWCWMMAATGLVYQQASSQLCSVYLPQEQAQAGVAIVGWAIAVFLLWAWHAVRASRLLDQKGGVGEPLVFRLDRDAQRHEMRL